MNYYEVKMADITPLKDELITLVSLCLIKEPPFKTVAPREEDSTGNAPSKTPKAPEPVEEDVLNIMMEGGASSSSSSPSEVTEGSSAGKESTVEDKEKAESESLDTITRIRRLVHYISLHDGEFALKLALYLRLELYIRKTPNFLVALCAREANCIPYLTPYIEKIVQLPSDWLSIANFAYFYDNDALHNFNLQVDATVETPAPALGKKGAKIADKKASPFEEGSDHNRKIPSGLRNALVSCFSKFDEFSLAKYNNENAEKRKRRKRKLKSSSDSPKVESNTFTLKHLIRLLHIQSPVYLVCCILGKRYPSSEEEFQSMGLAEPIGGRTLRVFDASKAGTRMRLAVPETWETRLSKEGNLGRVWDDLFASSRVPFMAMLRNLRNVILRQCSSDTYQAVERRLRSEEEVANSKQFPYRFFMASSVVKQTVAHIRVVQRRYETLKVEAVVKSTAPLRGRGAPPSRGRRYQRGRGRGRAAASPPPPVIKGKDASLMKSVECVADPSSLPFIPNIESALEQAALHAIKLNISPLKGSSVVVFCLSSPLLDTIKAMGSNSQSSSQMTYLESTALMIRMLQHAAENCTLLLWCHDTVKVMSSIDSNTPFMESVTSLVDTAHSLLEDCANRVDSLTPNEMYYNATSRSRFPYSYLDNWIENKVNIESLVIIDVGHHTYSNLNKDAPSLGDLPVYVNRLRRSGNKRMLNVGLSVRSSPAPVLKATHPYEETQMKASVRFTNPNDVLLTGFTDSVFRLVAERVNGGARAMVERMDELHGVKRVAIRFSDSHLAEKRRVLAEIRGRESNWRKRSVKELPKPLRPAHSSEMGITESPTSKEGGSFSEAICPSPRIETVFKNVMEEEEEKQSVKSEVLHPTSFISLSKRRGTNRLDELSTETTTDHHSVLVPRSFISTYRECRFFISSTFLDMNNERNALVLDVFPALRRWAYSLSLKVSLLEVDLRWGITESSTGENLSTSVCLNEVSRCSPFFIGMIGSRYGSCPSPLQIVADEDIDLDDYGWLSELSPSQENQLSVTELEMRHGIWNAKRKLDDGSCSTCVLFKREEEELLASLPDEERKQVYSPDSPVAKERIANLVEFVQQENVPIIPYRTRLLQRNTPDVAVKDSNDASTEAEMARAVRFLHEPFQPEKESKEILLPRSYMTNTAALWERKRPLTSMDVPLDMSDFSSKALAALQEVVLRACRVPVEEVSRRRDLEKQRENGESAPPTANEEFLLSMTQDMQNYALDLSKVYARPSKLIDELASFVITGSIRIEENYPSKEIETSPVTSGPSTSAPWRVTEKDNVYNIVQGATKGGVVVGGSESHILALVGEDGDGKSSALAAMTLHFSKENEANIGVIYYSAQASDGSLRGLVLYLVLSLLQRTDLQEEFVVHENDSLEVILQLLPPIYDAIKRRGATNLVVVLDGLDKTPEKNEILSHLGLLVFPGVEPYVRFVLSLTPDSIFLSALRSRVPPAVEVPLPLLSFSERAQLVRYHLASYGKKLQETFNLNELKDLLRKQDASHPSYITSALMYLRLFSCFDTLRDDIRYLPGTTVRLYKYLFAELERRFDKDVCHTVLTTLCIRQPVGGIMEYNLYRLVSNVSVATRLVALLSGTCITSHHGRLLLSSTFFQSSIASVYLPYQSDRTRAFEAILAAELLYQPLSTDLVNNKSTLRSVLESIANNSKTPTIPCLFNPSRYTPYELFSILQSATLGGRGDVVVALILYLPFVENIIKLQKTFQRFMSLLSFIQGTFPELITRKVEPVLLFLQNNYHILSRRPSLIFQCVQNSSREVLPMSTYSSAQVANLQGKEHCTSVTAQGLENSSKETESGREGFWVKWVNRDQHGGDSRLSVYNPSLYGITCLSISEKGDKVAMGCKNFTVRVSSLNTPELITANLKHVGQVTAVLFVSGKENILVSACESSLIYIWNLDGNTLTQIGASHLRPVTSLCCHPSEPLLMTGGLDSYCMFWDLLGSVSGLSHSLLSQAREYYGENVVLRPGISNKTLNKFSNLRARGKRAALAPFRVERHHEHPVSAVAFHSSGEICASGCWGGKLFLVNLSIIKPEHLQVRPIHEKSLPASRKENVDQTQLPYEYQYHQLNSAIRCLEFVPSLMIICAVACYSGDFYLFDFAAGRQSLHIRHSHNHPLTSMVFSSDGKWVATADEEGSLHLSFASVIGSVETVFNGHRGPINSLQFDPSREEVLVSAGEDGSIQLWSTAAKEKKKVPSTHRTSVTAVARATDGSFFVTGAADGTAFVFQQSEEDASALPGEDSATDILSFTPSFSLDHEGSRICTIKVAFQNRRILVGTVNGFIYVWSSSPGFSLREGRLLAKVPVSLSSAYSVIGIETCDGPHRKQGHEEDVLLKETKTPLNLYAYVTGVSFNGEIVSFYIFDSSISLTFQRKMLHDIGFGSEDEVGNGETEAESRIMAKRSSINWVSPGMPEMNASSSNVEENHRVQASQFGEELIGTMALHIHFQQEKVFAETHSSLYAVGKVEDHFSIAIGRRNVFLISHDDSNTFLLPIRRNPYSVMNDPDFSTELYLSEDEVFLTFAICESQQSETNRLISIATSEGNILLVELEFDRHTFGFKRTPESLPHTFTNPTLTLQNRVFLPKNEPNPKPTVSHASEEIFHAVPASEKLVIHSIDVSFMVSPETENSLYLFLGCEDGSTRLLGCNPTWKNTVWNEMGVFYGSSTLTAVSALRKKSFHDVSKQLDTFSGSSLCHSFWITGDVLGNVYQLCLEKNSFALRTTETTKGKKVYYNPHERARDSLLYCLDEASRACQNPESGEEGRGQTNAIDYLRGWSWYSSNLEDWLIKVKFPSIESELQTVSRGAKRAETHSHSSPQPVDLSTLLKDVAPNSKELFQSSPKGDAEEENLVRLPALSDGSNSVNLDAIWSNLFDRATEVHPPLTALPLQLPPNPLSSPVAVDDKDHPTPGQSTTVFSPPSVTSPSVEPIPLETSATADLESRGGGSYFSIINSIVPHTLSAVGKRTG